MRRGWLDPKPDHCGTGANVSHNFGSTCLASSPSVYGIVDITKMKSKMIEIIEPKSFTQFAFVHAAIVRFGMCGVRSLIAWGFLFLCILQPGLVAAQLLTPEERMIFIVKDTLRFDGTLTKEKHNEFWKDLNRFSKDDQESFLTMMRVGMVGGYELQIEFWNSALLSYRNRKVVKTGRLIELENETRRQLLSTLPTTISKREREAAIQKYESRRAIGASNGQRLLEAAAEHRSLRISEQEVIEMNEVKIHSVMTGLQPSFGRVNRLLNPVWIEK